MWEFVKSLFGGKLLGGVKDIIDEVVTSKEEKAILLTKFQDMIAKHQETILSMEVQDKISARSREVDTTRAGSKNWTQNILAYVGVVGFFGIIGFLLSKGLGEMKTEESFIIGNLTGMAGAIAKDIFGYYFGSSRGEDEHRTQSFDWNKLRESDAFKKMMSSGKEKDN